MCARLDRADAAEVGLRRRPLRRAGIARSTASRRPTCVSPLRRAPAEAAPPSERVVRQGSCGGATAAAACPPGRRARSWWQTARPRTRQSRLPRSRRTRCGSSARDEPRVRPPRRAGRRDQPDAGEPADAPRRRQERVAPRPRSMLAVEADSTPRVARRRALPQSVAASRSSVRCPRRPLSPRRRTARPSEDVVEAAACASAGRATSDLAPVDAELRRGQRPVRPVGTAEDAEPAHAAPRAVGTMGAPGGAQEVKSRRSPVQVKRPNRAGENRGCFRARAAKTRRASRGTSP